MPITFVTFLIASLAISGVPPLNGFTSKWMIYQGVVEVGKLGGRLWIVWLVAAFFGSALTLASFMKLLHAVFLGQQSKNARFTVHDVKEVSPFMWVPQVILAGLCIVLGVFASRLPFLKMFIAPSNGSSIAIPGLWNPSLATALVLMGGIIGIVIYILGTASQARETEVFMGGEILKDIPEMRVSGTEFYNTVQDIGFFRIMYAMAKKKLFDIYEVGSKITFGFNGVLRYLHNGVLPTYLAWCLLGMGVLFIFLLR